MVPESIACGAPVVTAAHVGASEVMTTASGIVVEELSRDSLCAALEQARSRRFEIPPDFIRRAGLDRASHIVRLIAAQPEHGRAA